MAIDVHRRADVAVPEALLVVLPLVVDIGRQHCSSSRSPLTPAQLLLVLVRALALVRLFALVRVLLLVLVQPLVLVFVLSLVLVLLLVVVLVSVSVLPLVPVLVGRVRTIAAKCGRTARTLRKLRVAPRRTSSPITRPGRTSD